MDKDRIAGSAKDFAGKVEGAVGDIAGDAKTQAAGRAREWQERTEGLGLIDHSAQCLRRRL